MFRLWHALSTSHLFPSSLLFLPLPLTLGPSGLCDTVLPLYRIGHLLQLEAFWFCLSLFQPQTDTHNRTDNTSHNTHYLPDLISSIQLSLELMSVTAHFNAVLSVKLKQITAGRVESLYVLGTGTFDVTTWETTASLLQLFPCFLQLLLTWISRTRQYHSDHRSPPKRRSYIEETLSPNN